VFLLAVVGGGDVVATWILVAGKARWHFSSLTSFSSSSPFFFALRFCSFRWAADSYWVIDFFQPVTLCHITIAFLFLCVSFSSQTPPHSLPSSPSSLSSYFHAYLPLTLSFFLFAFQSLPLRYSIHSFCESPPLKYHTNPNGRLADYLCSTIRFLQS
jgi:hypothetical protein